MPNLSGTSISNGTYTSYPWYTANGQKGSSTQNITGVYDLSGCILERVSAYIPNGNSKLTCGAIFISASANATGYQTLSTRLVTVYPYNSSSDSNTNNWSKYNTLKSANYGYGDAILEISTSGSEANSWNGDYSYFADSNVPFFKRGGYYGFGSYSGMYAFNGSWGGAKKERWISCSSSCRIN